MSEEGEVLTETVHAGAVYQTVPNTAAAHEDSDDWEDRVRCEVGGVAMTEIDRNISHGFSSENFMRGSQEGIVKLKNTDTEITGSRVAYDPEATGKLEFDP